MSLRLLLGELLVLAGSGGWGWLMASRLQRRPRELASLQTALSMLHTEIGYRQTPLPEALQAAAQGAAPAVRCLLTQVAVDLVAPEPLRTEEAWRRAMARVEHLAAWTAEDVAALRGLGEVLGASGAEDQVRHLSACVRQLQLAERRARTGLERRARMWMYLGVLAGAALVLLAI